jgi:hypothetical protein
MRRGVVIGLLVLLSAWSARAQQSPPPARTKLPPTITLPSELVTEIALYLQERPYREVAGLLGALQQAVAEQSREAGQSPAPKPPVP